jgi:multiple sugar transport system ATP-binding protein
MAAISLKQVKKAYGQLVVIHDMTLEIADGEFAVLVGPSGCGKSTLLRMIAGLEDISGGDLTIGDQRVNELAPADRNIAMVFQDYALYPHMSVEENMAFGLKMRNEDASEIGRRVADASEILKIQPYLDRRPAQLSGGQRQRVAMGRAIVRHPEAFLFDEPLSNLDASLRVEMRLEIAKLHRRMRATTVYVTHDQVEAMTLADRIVVMNAGRMEQVGAPMDLYSRPATLFVAKFLGSPTMNTLAVGVVQRASHHVKVRLPDCTLDVALAGDIVPSHDMLTLGIRPEDLFLCSTDDAWFTGQLSVVERLGGQTFGYLEIGADRMITVEFPRTSTVKPGDTVSVRGDARHVHLFDHTSGARLN